MPTRLLLRDDPVIATPRFWHSLFRRYGLTDAIFRYFTPAEVFERMSARDATDGLRFAVERHASAPASGTSTERDEASLLAISAPNRPLIRAESAITLIESHGAEELRYHQGRLITQHAPAGVARQEFRIGPDEFSNRFTLETPLDGYGDPRIYLALVRQVCANGAIAMQRAFTSQVRVGSEPEHALDRALGHYSNDEGFAALRQRFESAQRSIASVHEVRTLERLLTQLWWGTISDSGTDAAARALAAPSAPAALGAPAASTAPAAPSAAAARRQRFRRLIGDLEGTYGVANLEALSVKRQRLLPTRCRVYDLLNFATEVATHHLSPPGAARVYGWLGNALVEEYDLEGSAPDSGDFRALFVNEEAERNSALPARN